jgi:hypothetical protein
MLNGLSDSLEDINRDAREIGIFVGCWVVGLESFVANRADELQGVVTPPKSSTR